VTLFPYTTLFRSKSSIMLKNSIDLLHEEEGISFKLVVPSHGIAAVTVNFQEFQAFRL
jgi:hypothetical protein